MRARTIGRLYEPVPQLRTPPPWDEGSVSLPCEAQGRAHRLHVALVAPRDSSAVVYPWRCKRDTRTERRSLPRTRGGRAGRSFSVAESPGASRRRPYSLRRRAPLCWRSAQDVGNCRSLRATNEIVSGRKEIRAWLRQSFSFMA